MPSLACTMLTVFGLGPCAELLAQQIPNVQYVFQDLRNEATTDSATRQLIRLATTDPSARIYLAERLPSLIQQTHEGTVWLNAVRLTGDLRITEAIPVLTASLSRNNVGGTVTFAEEMNLDNDPVGKALAKIGDPAIPSVAGVLSRGDKTAQWRAALVLLNIDSNRARRLLQQYVRSGRYPELRELVQRSLR